MEMEDGSAIAEEFRCKRSDGKQWRCSARSMPDKTVCEKHYVQAKRRAANSALRASEKKARRKLLEPSVLPAKEKRYKERAPKGREVRNRELGVGKIGKRDPLPDVLAREGRKSVKDFGDGDVEEFSGRSTDSSDEIEGLMCHQCRRNDLGRVVWCSSCDKRGYCDVCASRRYPNMSLDDIQKVCPACRGICNCRTCLRGDNVIKARIKEMSSMDKLRHLHRILSFVVPMLKQIHLEQCYELDLEIRVCGTKNDTPRAILQRDEQMCCDFCKMPILDYHRHCANCQFDLCLMCCQDLRRASLIYECEAVGRTENIEGMTSNCAIEFSQFPDWRANSDGSIPCPHSASVSGCNTLLALRRIFKINWVARLVKHAEEMVNGCKISHKVSGSKPSNPKTLCKCSRREGGFDNFLYCPPSQDMDYKNILQFHLHWEKGEPVILKRSFEPSLSACWDPLSIWRGIQELADDIVLEDDISVKAINCSTQSEVDIGLRKFIQYYKEGGIDMHGSLNVFKLKDWPSENDVEEFLLCQRPEFLSQLPLLEFFHPKWGFLNLSAKLGHDSVPRDAGPKFLVACGASEEQDNIYILNLRISMSDVVYLLMHTSEGKVTGQDIDKFEQCLNNEIFNGLENEEDEERKRDVLHEQNGLDLNVNRGAVWDVFRRQDVPQLNKYLKAHWEDLRNPVLSSSDVITLPLFEQGIILDGEHKKRLKEEHGIEPWTFEQHIGEAVFVPAGCPFQVWNRQSAVHLHLDFLSPESLAVSAGIAKEIRSLPALHEAKLQMLEVGKMCLYAASSSIRYIQKIVLDPNLYSDIIFDDRNLTTAVAENLERVTKGRQIACL
ncbi:jmjC domain protein JMJ24 [Wolffia australiana]